jgi:hypothetical protein
MEGIDAVVQAALRHIAVGDGGGFGPYQDELAALPLCMGGQRVYRGQDVRPYAFLASALQFRRLQDEILGEISFKGRCHFTQRSRLLGRRSLL